MSKKSTIRWRESDLSELQRTINNYNAKLYRIKKNHPELTDILPQRMTKSQAVASIETRADFNRLTNSLQRFSKKGAEKPVEVAPKVKVTKWQQDETKKTLQQFNAKVTRLSKEIDPEILPEKISYEKATRLVETKSDFEWVKEQHEKFLQPEAEKLVKSTKGRTFTEWEVDYAKEEQRRSNEIKEKERAPIEKAPVRVGGEEQGVTRAEMGTVKENSLKDSERDPLKMSKKEYELFRKNMDSILDRQLREEKKEQMRQNYIKGLTDAGFLDADPDLLSYIEAVDIDTFVKTAETDDTATFIFYKDPQAFEVRLEYIKRSWQMAFYGQDSLWGVT